MTESLPSCTMDRYWIQEWAPDPQPCGPRVGKWVVTVPQADIDAVWQRILLALRAGCLGPAAKCRTALPNPCFAADGLSVICVYSYDARDVRDRQRVRKALHGLGLQNIHYKTDEQTRRDWRTCHPNNRPFTET